MPKSKKNSVATKKGPSKKQDPEIVAPAIEDTDKEEEPEFDPKKKVDDFSDFIEPDDLAVPLEDDLSLEEDEEDDEALEDDSDAY